jgi:hypothetical protein
MPDAKQAELAVLAGLAELDRMQKAVIFDAWCVGSADEGLL